MAQLVSASGLGPEGPVFESQYPDKNSKQLLEIQVVAFSFGNDAIFSGYYNISEECKVKLLRTLLLFFIPEVKIPFDKVFVMFKRQSSM